MEVVKKRWWAKRLVPISYADSFRIAYLMIGGVGLGLAAWVWLTTVSATRSSRPLARTRSPRLPNVRVGSGRSNKT